MWSGCRDLNPGPPRPERGALPSCATSRFEVAVYRRRAGQPAGVWEPPGWPPRRRRRSGSAWRVVRATSSAGSRGPASAPAEDGGVLVQGQLDQGHPAAPLGSQQGDHVLDPDGPLQQPGHHRRGRDGGVDPPVGGEQPGVLGVVDPRDHPGHRVPASDEQAHHQVVLVVAGGRDHRVDGVEAEAVQHPRLAGVAGDHRPAGPGGRWRRPARPPAPRGRPGPGGRRC